MAEPTVDSPVDRSAPSRRRVRSLYHLTAATNVESIIKDGVRPISYWGQLSVVHYYRRLLLHNSDRAMILRVSFENFLAGSFEPDIRGIHHPPNEAIEMTDAEVGAVWDQSAQTWQNCLDLIGSVAYRGVVPINAANVYRVSR